MSEHLSKKTAGDHVHLAARMAFSSIPMIGGPALELFNAAVAPPIERRRDNWLNDIAQRLESLEREKRLNIEDLGRSEEFVSVVLQATSVAVRNHQQEKIEALRNAVVNSALGQSPGDIKSAMFLVFVDQFTVWHLRAMAELAAVEAGSQEKSPKTSIDAIADVVTRRIAELRPEQALAKTVVDDLCRRGLLFWSGGPGIVTYIPRGTSQLTQLGWEFLKYISGS